MLICQGVHYAHPNKEVLFTDIGCTVNKQDKIALIGNNGTGKSTLLRLMAGLLVPSQGVVKAASPPYYMPQLVGQFNHQTLAQALHIDQKLQALAGILDGQVTDSNMALLNDDWAIEERCREAFGYWQLNDLDLHRPMHTLSGGQKTRVLLAGVQIHQPAIVLLDEPSNHLDVQSRQLLYAYVQTTRDTLVIVSHDRILLNLLDTVYELSKKGITVYGGNYDFYAAQKTIESNALNDEVKSKEKALRKAKETERETMERQQKLDARGKKKQEKAGLPTISMNTFRNNAEKSTARIKSAHSEKTGAIARELDELRAVLPDIDKMKIALNDATLHIGKVLVTAKHLNVRIKDRWLWDQGLDMLITSGERIAVKGPNGSGKTTLLKMLIGECTPDTGTIERATVRSVYIDQDYSLIDGAFNVFEQAQRFNTDGLQEHEIKIRLHRFLFGMEAWYKPCHTLSGGEKMRLLLCCLTIGHQAPAMIVLDEPTNNLDIQNVEILTAAVQGYKGTLVVVSHDEVFLEEVGMTMTIVIPPERPQVHFSIV